MPALEIKKLNKHFGGVRAVNNLSIEFKAGEITGIVGPNGSGKSTLVNLLTGIFAFDSGAVLVGGVSLKKIAPYDVAQYGITRTFQDVQLFEQMSVLDNLLVVLTERNVWGALREQHTDLHLARAKELLLQVGLWEKRNALAHNLSYGQRKLLEVARALAMNAQIYLFDEPFAGMFSEMTKIVSEILQNLRTQGKVVILIEHNMDLIRKLSNHLVVMDAGELLSEGKPEKVLAEAAVIEAYLGA